MNLNEITFLPGLNKQLKFLLNNIDVKDKSILILGSNTEKIARKLIRRAKEVIIIVDDQEDLSTIRFNLSIDESIPVRYMEYSNTDFINKKFDIIYAQGSITRSDRNKIVKELKKILQPEGIICIGEIISLTNAPPQFVKDVWDQSNLSPMITDKINTYYKDKGFNIIESIDLTDSLREFYTLSKELLKESTAELSKEEIKFYRKSLNKMKHEADVYLKLGGDQYIGFKVVLLRYNAE
jgi:SAM-dependent methyltransferase